MSVENKRAFMLHLAAEYIDAPEAFLSRWENDGQRREMFRAFTSSYGYDNEQMASLVDEDMVSLEKLAVDLGGDVAAELASHARYPGNKVYVESVSPAHASSGKNVHVSVVVWTRQPVAEVYLVSGTGRKEPLTTNDTTARKVFSAHLNIGAPDVWMAVAVVTLGAVNSEDRYTNAIQVR